MKEIIIKDINMETEKSLTKIEISFILESGIRTLITERAKCGGTQVMRP